MMKSDVVDRYKMIAVLMTASLMLQPISAETEEGKGMAQGKELAAVLKGEYSLKEIQGWNVWVDHDLMKDVRWADCRRVLDGQLFEIKRRLPKEVVKEMRKVKIFFDLKQEVASCACYHPNKQWLLKNGYRPEKEKSVELNDPGKFLKWTINQPCMLLHELAHAYHDQVLGFDHPKIIALYESALKSGKYQEACKIGGGKVKAHYAASNHKEYFAEAVEAYYGYNDFYPYVYQELLGYDPEICAYIKETWGKREN